MSALELFWNLDQESRISSLEAQVKEQKEQIEMLSKWIMFLINPPETKLFGDNIEACTNTNRGS